MAEDTRRLKQMSAAGTAPLSDVRPGHPDQSGRRFGKWERFIPVGASDRALGTALFCARSSTGALRTMTADGTDPGPGTGDDEGDTRAIPAEADRGKTVVDDHQREIGLVSRIEGDTFYLDPEPPLGGGLMAALGLDEVGGDELPIPPEFVDSIDDVVVLEIERDEEFHD